MPPNKDFNKVTASLLDVSRRPAMHHRQGCLTRLAYAKKPNLAMVVSGLAASHLAANLAELRSNSVRIDKSNFARTDVPKGSSASVFPTAGGTL